MLTGGLGYRVDAPVSKISPWRLFVAARRTLFPADAHIGSISPRSRRDGHDGVAEVGGAESSAGSGEKPALRMMKPQLIDGFKQVFRRMSRNSDGLLTRTEMKHLLSAMGSKPSDEGVGDLVEDGVTGWLVADNHVSGLATAIRRLLSDPVRGQEMGRRGRQKVTKDYSLEKMVRQYDALWEQEILASRR